jgi:hypothetical protein
MKKEQRDTDLRCYLETLAYALLSFEDEDPLKKERKDKRLKKSKYSKR